ncbi:transthyretin-like protein-like protein [Amylocarpus encephaloides]|uniref:5-hydroxyisourate hydrolase n=1 Tax=Amylocarpus encephaloides TaxID=45428 RepID=A0A9P7YG68_9HELO|nr:transthyretin-like protein-like protein [Amylocarpus encephaloides]
MAAERDPITCHVLDTTTGRPGASINVVLIPLSPSPSASQTSLLTATTNSDGRVTNWSNKSGDAGRVIRSLISECARKEGDASTTVCPVGSSLWKIEFDTGSYYGEGKCFFPKVELTFLVKGGEHFHVPLLLGPYSLTTYRGS